VTKLTNKYDGRVFSRNQICSIYHNQLKITINTEKFAHLHWIAIKAKRRKSFFEETWPMLTGDRYVEVAVNSGLTVLRS
jgi:hypothetical protein